MTTAMYMTQVASTVNLSKHLRRIILSGEDLRRFPPGQESAHVKVIIPGPEQIKPRLGLYEGAKKWMRSYTVRDFDEEKSLLTIDFSVNDHKGLASGWAAKAKVGDYLGIAGPGAVKHTNMHASWHLIIGDLTALPAIAATIERLPDDARGYACVQVPCESDRLDFSVPDGLILQWVVNDDHSKNVVLDHVKSFSPLPGEPAIFIAMEGQQMKAIKSYVRRLPVYSMRQTYASAYWNKNQKGQ